MSMTCGHMARRPITRGWGAARLIPASSAIPADLPSGFLASEQVFDGEYLKAGGIPEYRIEHTSTGGLHFHRGRGLGKADELAHG